MAVSSKYTQDLSVQIVFFTFYITKTRIIGARALKTLGRHLKVINNRRRNVVRLLNVNIRITFGVPFESFMSEGICLFALKYGQ